MRTGFVLAALLVAGAGLGRPLGAEERVDRDIAGGITHLGPAPKSRPWSVPAESWAGRVLWRLRSIQKLKDVGWKGIVSAV